MRTLLITGGSSGIGLATVQYFVSRQWQVFELSRSGSSSDQVHHIHCDVTDECSVQQAMAEVMRLTDHLDVVISNAGFGISGPIEFTDSSAAKKQFDVNFFGAFYLAIVALLPQIASILDVRMSYLSIGGTSMIIMVGVALETVKALEAQMLMRHYKGFLD